MKDKKLFLTKNKKSISPLIATILLIVVAIVIIIMVISWSRTVTDDSLDFDLETMYDLSNYSDYVWYDRITGPTLQIKNLGNKSFEIKGYKINSSIDSPYLNELITLDDPIQVLNNNTGVIPLFCIPEDEFTVEIVTSDNTYFNIPVKNARTRISSCSLDFQITSPEEASTFVLSQEISFSSEINKTLGDYTCSWDSNIDGSLSSDCSFTTSSLQEGTHEITLTVEDDLSQDTEEITINIKDNLGAEITLPNNNDTFNHNETITLVGISINSYGDVTCSWSSNYDGPLGSGCSLENVSLSENTHIITLTVEDDLEETTDSITLDVGSLSVSILLPLNNSEYEEGDSIFFDSSVEYPYQGTYSCFWSSDIDGTLSSDCSFTKNDLSLGSHEITLEVDDDFSTDSLSINLTINEPPPWCDPAWGVLIENVDPNICWQKTVNQSTRNHESAINYCLGRSFGGRTWDAPTDTELRELRNYLCEKHDLNCPVCYSSGYCHGNNGNNLANYLNTPAPTEGFTGFLNNLYWTKTINETHDHLAWYVDLENAGVYNNGNRPYSYLRVVCVSRHE